MRRSYPRTTEQAYDRLPEPSADAEDPGDASSSSDVDDSGSAGGPQCGDGDEDQSAPSTPSGDNSPQEQDEPGSGSGSAGSEPSGQTPASHDPCGTGEVMDADERRDDATGQSGESPVDTPAEEQAWDEAMHQAASLARAQGNAPGAVEETIRQAHRSILDWRSLLRRHMTDAARRDYSWSVPNPRFIDSGLYLPSMHSQGIDAIAIIIDTSASRRHCPQGPRRFAIPVSYASAVATRATLSPWPVASRRTQMPRTGTRSPSARRPTRMPAWVSALPEQQVAGGAVERAHAVHPIFELDVGLHPEPPRSRGSDAHQVRLHRAGDQHRISAACLSLAEVELELAHLVAA